ncbi:hypothetical protein DL990_32960 [Amycolatopsis sp. WAC 01416]|nr:hypothetical protein DL990_32960 [Amycolatopsis sp. WAC 01416]
MSYLWKHGRSGDKAHLDLAIEMGERAVGLSTPAAADTLNNLAITYLTIYKSSASPSDAARAIELGEQALPIVTGTIRVPVLSNLGLTYRQRYRNTGIPGDLDRAIALGEEALACTPEDHPSIGSAIVNVAISHRLRLDQPGHTGDMRFLSTIADNLRSTSTSPPLEQVTAHYAVGGLALAMNALDIAVESLDTAVELLPSVVPRHAGTADQEARLSEHLGLVGEAFAAHCAAADPTGALRIAELGRGLLLGAQLDARADLTELGAVHPGLAERFRALRKKLDAPEGDRLRLWAEHDELLGRIRRRPGFERFLTAVPFAELRTAAENGHVVLVNAGEDRGDAVIVSATGDPIMISLPGLTGEDARSRAGTLLSLMHGRPSMAARLRRQRELSAILVWLWDKVVAPVLGELPTSNSTPRVWWLPIGVLGLFPLHAAGHPGQPGALDAVVSSYTTTLRALAQTRKRPAAKTRRQLVVGLKHTPGMPDLPGRSRDRSLGRATEGDLTAPRPRRHHHPSAGSVAEDDLGALRLPRHGGPGNAVARWPPAARRPPVRLRHQQTSAR